MGFVTGAELFDVVSLGDVVNDQIIRLPRHAVRRRSHDGGDWLEIPLGRKVALEEDSTEEAGGSAANAAVALSRLGLRVGLSSFLAHDQVGLDILAGLRAHDVDTRLVHVDAPAHTVRNFVLAYEGERTILVRHAGFRYHWDGLRESEVPSWLFVTSLGPDALDYQDQIADWLAAHPSVRLAFHPGSFQAEAGASRLARLIARAELVVVTRAVAAELMGAPDVGDDGLVEGLARLGARRTVLVDPEGGAVGADGARRVRVPPFPADHVQDRTGANDAFASTVVAALVRGLDLPDAIAWGAVNYASVAGAYGSQAGLLHEGEMRERLRVPTATSR